MNTERFMEMVNLRRCGFTYQEIGNRLGVSRQYVYECIGRRFRGNLAEIKRVKLRAYFQKTSMSIPTFAKLVFGNKNATRGEQLRVHHFLRGGVSHFRIDDFLRMSKLTGLSLEELAELDIEVE
jgi:hypothetical protein